jgi:hypothetical protein
VKHIAHAAKRSSLRSAVIHFVSSKRTAYWLELLLEGGIVSPEKLAALRQECDELIAIFVTIVRRYTLTKLVNAAKLPYQKLTKVA